ncbi:MAG TPA: helix-turn-helix domain-containing protein [Mycobacterium sp.]|jgi:TetR/AcrR family transcriptional regulator, regulator of cefoperazone and chloramphenicol sensitivity|uniref:TetR/AcrR family transcriptional regulator n=1 Tax=Mycobacterium sp. TaxID=1785 RepID=UPI002D6FCB29|nr:helix-turn-helix domain-containing protein [Mycobacterium sp.]HXY64228.1 helix-turn-helix domain-containing protein [Mycobacterium sp.]
MTRQVVVTSAEDLSSRARLRDAAVRLFAERGVAGTSVRDIAEAAGVTAGLITHHFGSKERLKAAVDELMIEVFTAPLTAPSDLSSPTAEGVAEALAHTMAAHPDLRAYLRRSFLENDPASGEVFDRFVELLRERLAEMQAAGMLRADLDLDWAPLQVLFLHFGPLLLGPAVERILNIDSYADDVIRRRSRAHLELVNRGFLSNPSDTPGPAR